MEKGFFRSNFQGTIPGDCTFSENRYPKVDQPLGNNVQQSTIFDYRYPNIFRVFFPIFQFPRIVTQKLINLWVTIPGNRTISRYCYLEIYQPLGNNTGRLIQLRSLLHLLGPLLQPLLHLSKPSWPLLL